MADLPKEWEAIIDAGIQHHAEHGVTMDAIREAVERCYALHNQPPKWLTDAEIDKLWAEVAPEPSHKKVLKKFADAILAAHERKQREPEVVEFRAARGAGSDIVMLRADRGLPSLAYEWADHGGKPQTFKVVLS